MIPPIPPRCLEGLRVIEVARGVAGAYCGRMLSTLGADVLKVEPPGLGDYTRTWGPFAGDLPDPERSLLFLNLNLNKRGITLDVASTAGRGILKRLLGNADVLLLANEDPRLDRADIDALQAEFPNLIIAVMRPFGLDGPYAGFLAEGLNLFQVGGSGYLNPAGFAYFEKPEGQPLDLAGHTSDVFTGLVAAISILAAYFARPDAGGQVIDLSQQEAHLNIARQQLSWYANEGLFERRETYHVAFGGCVPCKDGYVEIYVMADDQWRSLIQMMGNPEWMLDERFKSNASRAEFAHEIHPRVVEWAAGLTKAEIYALAQQHGSPSAYFATPGEVTALPHEHARQFFASVDHPVAGVATYPVHNVRMSETPVRLVEAAPTLGQHNREVYMEHLGLDAETLLLLSRTGVI